jgi:solute carrier family 25 carnitine/acylcarnitine transporter 20/29
MIAARKHIKLLKPPGTIEAVKDILRTNGITGLYTGFRLHFGEIYLIFSKIGLY